MAQSRQLIKKIKLQAEMELLTGLHIGDSKENVEIGGVDTPVIKRKLKRKVTINGKEFELGANEPYIPGSSLKGKIRCLLEQIRGCSKVGKNKKVNLLFGYSEDKIPSRIIVRDAYLTPETAKALYYSEFTDMPYTEIKFENVIDRVKGMAEHPRQIERIPAGAKFNIEFIINIFRETDDEGKEETDDPEELVNLLNEGLKALQEDYLGGSGSRGYGQVKLNPEQFSLGAAETIDFSNYFEE